MDICKDGQASQGDGKKRRSFLPAPKKSFGAPQMSGQMSPNLGPFQDDQSPTLPMPPPEVSLWSYQNLAQSYPAGPESREQARTSSSRSHQSDRHRTHKRTEEQAFGVGLRIGARIMIGGIKPGILRYLGTTHFAHGIFCGIELCDPDGNHDGKVQGHRYFVCAPNHGIFAPKEKVCLDMSGSLERMSASSDFIYSSLDSLNESLSRASRNKELVAKDIHGRGSTGAKYSEYVSYMQSSAESRAPAHGEGAVQAPRLQVTEDEWLEFQRYKEQCQMEHEQGMFRAARSHQVMEATQLNRPDYQPHVDKNSKDVLLRQDVSSRHYRGGATTSSDKNSSNSSSSGWEPGRASPSRGGRDPRSSEDDEEDEEGRYTRDTLSADVKDQLRADSRHYLNFTFDRDSLNQSFDPDDSGSDWDKESRKNAANLCSVGSTSGAANQATCSPARHLASQPPYSRTDSGKQDTHAVDSQYVDGSTQLRAPTRSSLELGRGNLSRMGDGQELSEGYGPDTDSELGTLTTNTPSTDWADKVVAETDHNNRKFLQNSAQSGQTPGSQHAVKTRDEDDHGTDLTSNTEDERAEADQMLGRSSKTLSSSSPNSAVSKDKASETNNKENSGTTQMDPGTHQSGSTDSTVDSPTKDDDNQEERDLEEGEQQNSTKPRKTMVITKKRSDNIDHKMPNINVTSRLADYIKTPVPIKSKEDKEKEQKKKLNKNVKNVSHKRLSITETSYTKQDISRSPSVDKDFAKEEPEKPKQIIKRAPPKSKWGDIMSQIESNKDTAKLKALSEVKSPLAAYLSAPPPQQATEGEGGNRREFKSKLKQLPPPPPKIDFSKVKSKLNVPTAASAMKALPKHELSSHTQKLKSDDGASPEDGESIIHENGEDVIGDGEGGVDQHLKGESMDQIRKHDRRPSAVSVKADQSETRTAQAQSNKSVKSQKKAALPPANQARKPQAAGKPTANIVSNISSIRGNINFATRSALKEEVERLESLCEARIEELVTTKLELEAMTQAFDALAVIVNYCNSELKAFECPDFERKLENTSRKLEECLSEIADLSAENEHLATSLEQVTLDRDQEARQRKDITESSKREKAEHIKTVEDLNNTHNTALSSQREEMSATHEQAMKKFGQFHEIQIQLLSQTHDRQVADMTNENKLEVNQLKICHLEETQELRNKHDKQIEEIHQQHRNKLDDMTNRYETIKISLLEKVESLRKECEELAMRARNSEEALRRDSDVKVQMALAPYLTLPDEIKSLKAVQEMRLEEIQKLRTKNMDLEKQLEEIFIAREKIISLQQKVESLGAIINIKTEHEKQLHEKCLVLIRKYDHQARANKRISMDYEQVMWKMSQSLELGSSESLSRQESAHSGSGSPVRGMSPRGSRVDMRHGSGHTVSEVDRKHRSRSAVLFTEDSSDSHLPTPSPRLKHKRWRKKSEADEVGSERRQVDNRMCQSAGAELMSDDHPDDPSQEIIWDDSNVSIMLTDLTTSQIESAPDLARSYARSLSGVTDSGVYDSLTRSDVLDGSMVSTDSGWVTSQHFTSKRDSAVSECESGPPAGDYNVSADAREPKFKTLPA